MEICPSCSKVIPSLKLLKCKFCERNYCSLSCLINHAKSHQVNPNTSINLVNSLKRRQSDNLTEQYSFITSGDFHDKINFDKKYEFNNFTKVIEGIFPKELGSGSFGRVFLVAHNETKELFALKTIEKRKIMTTYGRLDIIHEEIKDAHPSIFSFIDKCLEYLPFATIIDDQILYLYDGISSNIKKYPNLLKNKKKRFIFKISFLMNNN